MSSSVEGVVTTTGSDGARAVQDGVEMRPSLIPGAGMGLFATRAHKRGDVVCEYVGTIFPNKVAWKRTDKAYLMKLGEGKYVDALEHPEVLARYINDCRRRAEYNVVFDKRPSEDRALVIALRDIGVDEELYVDYGRFYWIAYNLLHPEHPVR
ncbi:hypothetical protein Poli38472_001714 [Pythium oligandrum]|uniref:SET domain-containing protein n=1 Tax=Pythium oligandrum TaxID=41045 RepID=A0A8K1CV77_PYTOL|nr:hypothetical protein Poli38472_001714 [Pythium oligandrum]|eukprot:TMW69558.1 hypothetical protein Poli38472_001714 [Pythium oligandrum]